MFLRVFFLAFTAILFANSAYSFEETSEANAITEPIPVTVEELVKNPLFYHDKKIVVRGFLTFTFGLEAAVLYHSFDDFLLWKGFRSKNSLAIRIAQEIMELPDGNFEIDDQIPFPRNKYQRAEVIITAVMDAKTKCGSDLPPEKQENVVCLHYRGGGGISQISKIEVLSYPYLPSLKLKHIEEYEQKYETHYADD